MTNREEIKYFHNKIAAAQRVIVLNEDKIKRITSECKNLRKIIRHAKSRLTVLKSKEIEREYFYDKCPADEETI